MPLRRSTSHFMGHSRQNAVFSKHSIIYIYPEGADPIWHNAKAIFPRSLQHFFVFEPRVSPRWNDPGAREVSNGARFAHPASQGISYLAGVVAAMQLRAVTIVTLYTETVPCRTGCSLWSPRWSHAVPHLKGEIQERGS